MDKKKKHKTSWTRRMIVILVLVVLVPTFLVITIVFNVAVDNLEGQAYELADYRVQQKVKFVERDLQQIFDLMYQVITDKEVTASMGELYHNKNVVEGKSSLRSKFISYGQMIEAIQSMTYIDDIGENYYTYEKFNSAYDNGSWSDKERRLEICHIVQSSSEAVFFPTRTEELAGGKGIDLFYIALPLQDYVADTNNGFMIMGIGMEFFENLDMGNETESEWEDQVDIIDDEGNIIFSQDSARIGEKYGVGDYKSDSEAEKLVKEKKIEKSNWILQDYMNMKDIKKDLYGFQRIVLLICVIFIAPLFGAVWALNKYFRSNLKQLSLNLKKIGEGQVGIQLDTTIEAEFYPVVQQFNQMSKSIERLIKRLERERAQSAEALSRQREAELRALEAQINPHFLYNTLDSINWRAIENEEYEISEMVSCLGDLLRYSISDIDGMVCVSEEGEWLNKYLFLQQKRFGDKFTFSIQIPEEVQMILIHKMLLQPIIENCVVHGMEEIKEKGIISVVAAINQSGKLQFSIKDNGKGMDEKTLSKLNNNKENGNIGTNNVKARLESYYGKEAAIWYHSVLAVGIILGKCRIKTGPWSSQASQWIRHR